LAAIPDNVSPGLDGAGTRPRMVTGVPDRAGAGGAEGGEDAAIRDVDLHRRPPHGARAAFELARVLPGTLAGLRPQLGRQGGGLGGSSGSARAARVTASQARASMARVT
jgi:hypothetical protein